MTIATMRADGNQLVGAKADLSTLLGTWHNAMAATDHIAKVSVTEKDGRLLVQLYGSADGELVDWGEQEATPYVANGSTEVPGYFARYELGDVRTELAFNEKQGVLVIQSYTSFHDGSGRLSHYAREFFHQAPALPTPGGAASLVGAWVNTKVDTEWITGFELERRDGTLVVRTRGASDPADWGEAEATVHLDAGGDAAFHASYDLGSLSAELAANQAKGLIVIATFLRFADGRDNVFCREFYYRQA